MSIVRQISATIELATGNANGGGGYSAAVNSAGDVMLQEVGKRGGRSAGTSIHVPTAMWGDFAALIKAAQEQRTALIAAAKSQRGPEA